jgi:hypothetical protein
MRSSRLLIKTKNKFTDFNKPSSPTRMPEARYGHPHKYPGFNPGPGSASGLGYIPGRGYSCINQRVPLLYHSESLLSRITSLKIPITTIPHRSFSKGPDLPKEANLNQFYFKRFLRLKAIEFTETHACIKLDIPIVILNTTLHQQFKPTDLTTPTVHINKRTGNFVIPSHGVHGTWQDLELLLNIWVKNRILKRNDVKKEYPSLRTISSYVGNQDWEKFKHFTSIQSISSKDFEDLLNNLNLSKQDYNVDEFSSLQAKVDDDLNTLVVPVRYFYFLL